MSQTSVLDQHPVATAMQQEILQGLLQTPKHLPSKYLYDARGAALFEQICNLPEYYLTRTETSILHSTLPQLADKLGCKRWVVEPGSGSGSKTLMLLDALQQPAGYVPIDISKQQLRDYADDLQRHYPQLKLRPVCADFTSEFPRPPEVKKPLIWFPGSTIGNFQRSQAEGFLRQMAHWAGPGADLLIGVDLVKPVTTLEAAYDDAAGITAQFNLNLLHHLNQAAACDFQPHTFHHKACWNAAIGAIQMFLISQRAQTLHVGGQAITLAPGEQICTEYSHKYSPADFRQLAASAGWIARELYTDARQWFGVFHFSLN